MDNHLHPITISVKECWYKKILNATSIKIHEIKVIKEKENPQFTPSRVYTQK